MECSVVEMLISFAVVLVTIYYYVTSTFDFWSKRGIPGPKPIPFVGNIKDIMFARSSVSDWVTREYQNYKDKPWFGIFTRRTPVLVVKDPEIIKHILIKDFSTFSDRGEQVFEKVEPLSQHLFALEPARWKPLRNRLSPTFTSGKLKEMFYLLTGCAENFRTFLEKTTERNSVIECRDLTAKFTTDVIGTCAFGLEMNALSEEESEFRKFGRKVFENTGFKLIRLRIKESMPWLYNLLHPIMYEHDVNNFFIGSITQTMEYRKKSNTKRNDFVDLLMEIRDNPSKLGNIEMTDALIAAQAFVFFLAGFETSSSTMSYALFELALNQSIQDKVRHEIEEHKGNDGGFTYETIKNMKYLHKVFCETLRKYPVVPVLTRNSTEPYTFVGTEVMVPKDQEIWIPVFAIQRDAEIYPDPETFDPERFNEENVKQRHPSFYLPFGDGPRNCIGARFANYQSKIGLIKVFENFKVEICKETSIPLVNNPTSFLLQPKNGIKLKFTKLHR